MHYVCAVCRLSVIWHLCRGYETTRLITSMAARDVVSGVTYLTGNFIIRGISYHYYSPHGYGYTVGAVKVG